MTVNGPVYANGPVFVQGVDVRLALDEINTKISKIEQKDLVEIKKNIDKMLSDFPVDRTVRVHLTQLKNWIDTGKTLKEIVDFLKQSWLFLGPIVTKILLEK